LLLLAAQVKVPGRVSEEGRSFITSCLQREAVNRPTAAALLRHPWVRLHA
jgi:serine/threonine protein kinase